MMNYHEDNAREEIMEMLDAMMAQFGCYGRED